MNFRLVFRIIAILLLVTSAFMATSLLFAWHFGEEHLLWSFLLPIIVVVAGAGGFLLLTRGGESEVLSGQEGFLVVTLSWVSVSVVGAFPLFLSGEVTSFTDALFETVSGFTTTGATILTDIEVLPKSLLFWRSLTHWLGGMGIIVLTVAIFPILGIGGLQLIKAEAPGPTVDKITPKITETAKILWFTYVAMSAAETLLLIAGGLDLYDALTHTFGTVATGGFSPKNLSVGHYGSPYIEFVVTVFMVMAGVNFLLYYRFLSGRGEVIFIDSEFKAYIGVFVGATLLCAVSLYANGYYESFADSLRYAGFQSASILTTTGYTSADYSAWPALPQVVLFVLMFVGASSGSTGGGIKVVRILTLLKQAVTEMKYLIHPRGIFTTRLSGSSVRKNIVYAIAGFVFLYLLLLLITTVVVAADGLDILSSFSTALVTLGNIGPGFGMVGPTENYAFFSQPVKLFLSLIMITGRLEVFTVLVIFTPAFWRR